MNFPKTYRHIYVQPLGQGESDATPWIEIICLLKHPESTEFKQSRVVLSPDEQRKVRDAIHANLTGN